MLVDPRDNQPFYIGKGKGRRAKTHLWPKPETRNVYKENKITIIREEGLEPIINYIIENILDEKLAYDIEKELILKYGRKGYDKDGILTNVCIDARPPNHKGKSYEEIYGNERANIERKKRTDIQLARGGYGPKKHTSETKEKLRYRKALFNEQHRLTENDLLEIGKKFCEYFDNEISRKKWKWWAKENNVLVNIINTYRFNRKCIFDIFVEKFNAIIKHDSLLWFYNPITNKNFRCFDWELKFTEIPDGFIRGRGKIKKDRSK
jgi:hypothetical protein